MSEDPASAVTPDPGAAAQPLSPLGARKLETAKETNDDGYKSVAVSIDGTIALFARYDPTEVNVNVDLSVKFKALGGAAGGGGQAGAAPFDENFFVERLPPHRKPPTPPMISRPTGPPHQ